MANKKIDLIEKFKRQKRPLILDGALGSLLQQKGFNADPFLWYSKYNIENPKLIESIHKGYINAGAGIITTNTFRTNPVSLKQSVWKFDQKEFVGKSVQIAVDAREDKEIIIAGSNAPAEDCYQSERTVSKFDLDYNHKKHLELLWESGVDIIWNETQSHWDEIEIICRFCSKNSILFVVNLYFTENIKILSGEPVFEVVQFINDFNPVAVGFNCIKLDTFKKYFEENNIAGNWGFYLNCGSGNVKDENISCGINPEEYVKSIQPFLQKKPVYIGSCCGSSPLHTKAIKEFFNEIY